MSTVVEDLKARARALHRQVQVQERGALARVRTLPELRDLDDAAVIERTQRRHCLALIARDLGFAGWPHATAILQGQSSDDFGTLLYPHGASAHWNIWSASYDEARTIRAQHGGYLLAYRRHYFISDRYFIETLGLNPDDPDWERIGRDWVHPTEPTARERLYAALIHRRLENT